MEKPFLIPEWFPKRFWNEFRLAVGKRSENEKTLYWITRRFEQFIGTLAPAYAEDISEQRVTAFLNKAIDQSRIEDWQLRQAFEAIEIGLSLLKLPWTPNFDWSFWLESTHSPVPSSQACQERRPVPVSEIGFQPSTVKTDVKGERDALVRAVRLRGLAIRTERSYEKALASYLRFAVQNTADPSDTGTIQAFLESLVLEKHTSSSNQSMHLNAIVFWLRHVKQVEEIALGDFLKSKRKRKLPVALSEQEVRQLLSHLEGDAHLMTALLYGTGMHLMECIRLRVQDIDFNRHLITVRQGKAAKTAQFLYQGSSSLR